MKRIKRILSLILFVVMSACLFASCAFVPKDAVEINVITSKGTYRAEENVTEIFLALDVNNGKERSIEKFEADAVFYMKDGTSFEQTLYFDEKVEYSYSSLVRVTFNVEGRVDHFEIKEYRVDLMNYWESFGKVIITAGIIFLAIGILFAVFMAAEMTGALSLGAGAIVLFDIAMLLFIPFSYSIILILASILAFVPMLIYHFVNEY